MITSLINLNRIGQTLLGPRYNETLDYVMVIKKERKYIYKKYFYINKITNETILFFVDIIGDDPDLIVGGSTTGIYIDSNRKIINPNTPLFTDKIDEEHYFKLILNILDSDTYRYINPKSKEVKSVFSNSPLIIEDNLFTLDSECILGKLDVLVTPIEPPQNQDVTKFVSSTISSIENKLTSIFSNNEYRDTTNLDMIRTSDPFNDIEQIQDMNFLVDINLLLNIVSNPDELYKDLSNMVEINIYYKYFIQGDLVKVHLDNGLSLNLKMYHCKYFENLLYYMDVLQGEILNDR